MRGIARIIGFIFATGTLVFVAATAIFAGVIWKYEQDLPDYTVLKNYEPPVMTRVHAADGSLLAEYSRERRLYLPADEFLTWSSMPSSRPRIRISTIIGASILKELSALAWFTCRGHVIFRVLRPSRSRWPRIFC
jgi:hypothetical protein